jgi:hypothetical protein
LGKGERETMSESKVSKVLFLSVIMVLQTAVYPMLVQSGWSLGDLTNTNGVIADGSDANSAVGSTDDYTFTIELPAEAIHANTQIVFDFPTGRDNTYSNIQIDDVLIHAFRYADTDDDGLLDIVDLDSDGDGLLDADELAEGTNRTRFDSDGDGAWDGHEVNYFDTDPLGPDDADGDLIPDWYDLDQTPVSTKGRCSNAPHARRETWSFNHAV